MRRLEVALIEYRESLEERGVKSLEEIERKVAVYRRRLQSEYGLLDSGEDIALNISAFYGSVDFSGTCIICFHFCVPFKYRPICFLHMRAPNATSPCFDNEKCLKSLEFE